MDSLPIFSGEQASPSNSSTNYHFINAIESAAWGTNAGARQIRISDDCTLTSFSVAITNAPNTGNSWNIGIRINGTLSSAQVTLSDSDTLQTWTGSVSVSEGDLLDIVSIPSSTPDDAGPITWLTKYDTPDDYFLLLAGHQNASDDTNTAYHTTVGGSPLNWSTAVNEFEIIVPTDCTVTKMSVNSTAGGPGAGDSYDVSLRVNDTTDYLTTTIDNANLEVSTSGTVDLSPGDAIVVKNVPSGTPNSLRLNQCFTVYPDILGETFFGYANPTELPTLTDITNWEQPLGVGGNGWTQTESNRNMGGDSDALCRKLYVRISVAPGAGSSRTFYMSNNSTPTSLSVTFGASDTSASDTSNSFAVTSFPNDLLIETTTPGTAPAEGYANIGYVIFIPQGSWPGYYGFEGWF